MVDPTNKESSGLGVFWKKLRMLAFGFAGFLAKPAPLADFFGVLERLSLVAVTMLAMTSSNAGHGAFRRAMLRRNTAAVVGAQINAYAKAWHKG